MDDSDYQFRAMLKSLDDGLTSDDICVLKFLCQDSLPASKLDNIHGTLDLLSELERAHLIQKGDLQLLAELLFEAQRIDLMRKIKIKPAMLDEMKQASGQRLNTFRLMLHQLSEQMMQEDVKKLKYLMTGLRISPSKLEQATDAYSLFTLLEKQELITRHDVSKLLDLAKQMEEKELTTIIEKYMDDNCVKPKLTVDRSIQYSLQPQTSTDFASHSLISEYNIGIHSKGICLIINNDQFEPSTHGSSVKRLKGARNGSAIDADKLKQVFEMLNFRVRLEHNLKSHEIVRCVSQYSKTDHTENDVFVCCILSHGEAGKVFGTDCLPISIHSILSKFKPSHCPSLKDKPKIFFIQACGGGRKDDVKDESLGFEALPLIDGVGDPDPGHDLETDYAGRLSIVTSIPRSPDFLLGLATVPGFVSYRSKSTGSWYIQALCKALHKYHNTEDLWTILTEVNNKVSKMQQTMKETIAHQMPLPASTLCKRVYLRTDSGGARR